MFRRQEVVEGKSFSLLDEVVLKSDAKWKIFSSSSSFRIFTLYSKSLPLDVACRVWDVFCRDGEESLFRTGLGILRLFQDVLLQMDFIHIAQFLSRLPEDLPAHTLFSAMANTHMISRNRRWAQVGGVAHSATRSPPRPENKLSGFSFFQVFSTMMKDGNKESDRNASPALRS